MSGRHHTKVSSLPHREGFSPSRKPPRHGGDGVMRKPHSSDRQAVRAFSFSMSACCWAFCAAFSAASRRSAASCSAAYARSSASSCAARLLASACWASRSRRSAACLSCSCRFFSDSAPEAMV